MPTLVRNFGRTTAAKPQILGFASAAALGKVTLCFGLLLSWQAKDFAAPPIAPAPGRAAAVDLHELYFGAHLPRDRSSSRAVDLAERLLTQQRYSEAMPLLLRLLERQDDVLLENGTSGPQSLRMRVKTLLANLPAAGERAYALESEASAARLMDAARGEGNLRSIAAVYRQRPETAAAAQALWLLGQACSELGEPELAALAFGRLQASSAAGAFEPQLSLRRALVWVQAGKADEAERVVRGLLRTRHAAATIEPVGPLSDSAAVLNTLRMIAQSKDDQRRGDPALQRRPVSQNWLYPGGDRRGNPSRAGGEPHLWPRWSAMTVVDPREEEDFLQAADWLASRGRPPVPASQPIAVGNLVVFRSGENLVAIDWSSGRRLWETRPSDPRSRAGSPEAFERFSDEAAEQLIASPSMLTKWFDAVAGRLSSDGQFVYAIEAASLKASADRAWSPFSDFRGRARLAASPDSNRLVAYQIASEGKLAWTVGGGSKGPLAGAFFLEAPKPVGESLIALVEVQQSLLVVGLDRESGSLLWKQPLASVERGVEQNAMRRLVGGATAVSSGVVVCSTGVGVVMAIDLLDRSIRWVDRFPVDERRQATSTLPWRRRRRDDWPKNATQTWLENRVIVEDDAVVVASPESPQLHCLDLETGEARWRADRDSGALVAGVADGVVIVCSAERGVGLDLTTGDRLWTIGWSDDELDEADGSRLAGRPVVTGGRLLVPLTGGELLALDASTGQHAERFLSWAGGIGNLIAHRGGVLSFSPASLDRYDGREELLAKAHGAIDSENDHASASCVVGEHLIGLGRFDEAVSVLMKAYRSGPTTPLLRSRLKQAVTHRITAQGPTAADLALLRELVEGRDAERGLRVSAVDLAAREGRLGDALLEALPLASPAGIQTPMAIGEAGHFATPARRASGLVARSWAATSDAGRQQAMAAFTQAKASPSNANRALGIARVYAGVPLGFSNRGALVEALRSEGQRLASEFYQVEAGGATPRSAYQHSKTELETAFATRQVASQVAKRSGSNPDTRERVRRSGAGGWRPVRLIDANPRGGGLTGLGFTDLAIDVVAGRLVGFDAWGESVFHADLTEAAAAFVSRAKQHKGGGDVLGTGLAAWRYGPCLYVASGEQVVAIECLASSPGLDRQLWSTEGMLDRLVREQRRGHRWRRQETPRSAAVDPSATAQIIAVGERGVVLRKGDAIACVDGLTGTLQWLRSDLTFTSQAAADDWHVYAVTADGVGRVLSLLDGEEVGEWRVPEGRWLANVGGCLVVERTDQAMRELAVVDLASGKKLGSTKATTPAPLAWLDDRAIGMLGSRGRFSLLELRTGIASLASTLELRSKPQSLTVASRHGRVVAAVGYSATPASGRIRFEGLDAGRTMTGDVFCLDAQSGQASWSRPASIRNRAWLLRQPRNSPLLLFGARREDRSSRRVATTTGLLAIDVLSGRAAYRDDELEAVAGSAYRVQYRPGPRPAVNLTWPQTSVLLEATEASAPPAPPASDIVEAPTPSGEAAEFAAKVQQALGNAIRLRVPNMAPPEDDLADDEEEFDDD